MTEKQENDMDEWWSAEDMVADIMEKENCSREEAIELLAQFEEECPWAVVRQPNLH